MRVHIVEWLKKYHDHPSTLLLAIVLMLMIFVIIVLTGIGSSIERRQQEQVTDCIQTYSLSPAECEYHVKYHTMLVRPIEQEKHDPYPLP